MRVIIYTGKGGVGKTSMAAASACVIAESGQRVLVMSTDQAHSLGDSFGVKLGKEPKTVGKNIDALEIDTVYESEKSWGNIKEYMKAILTLKGGNGIEVEELLVFPGLEELFALFKILEVYEKGDYDVLIVDCAPTGETLSLLKYPEQLSGFIEKVLPAKRKGVKVAGPLVEKIMKIPMPKDNVFDDIEFLMGKMRRLQKLLLDQSMVSLRVVTTPEKIVIREAKRTFTCLYLYNYNVDAIIINRIYPQKAMEGYFSKWVKLQEEGLKEIEESFSEVPKFKLELQQDELRQINNLLKVGKELFKEVDASKVLFYQDIYRVMHEKNGLVLEILLPFAEKPELELSQRENEIILSFRNETRRFPLPIEAKEKEIIKADFKKGYLQVHFK